MANLQRNLYNRRWLVERLTAEVIGPDPAGDAVELDEDGSSYFTWEEFRKPKCQANGEEILWQDPPIKRYGAGILFPGGVTELRQLSEEANSTPDDIEDIDLGQDVSGDETLEEKAAQIKPSQGKTSMDDTEDHEITLANAYRPAAMGISFLADLSYEKVGLLVEVEAASYRKLKVRVGQSPDSEVFSERYLWCRVPVLTAEGNKPTMRITTSDLTGTTRHIRKWVPGLEGHLQLVVVSRTQGTHTHPKKRLLTVCLVNQRTHEAGRLDDLCFFQCGIHIRGESSESWILPYPGISQLGRPEDGEEQIVRLLYRDRQTFAIGHGCSVEWPGERPQVVGRLRSDFLPTFETPSISADIVDDNKEPIRVSMRKLAGLDPADDGRRELNQLVEAYDSWIECLKDPSTRTTPVPDDLTETANLLLERCSRCLERVSEGIAFLAADSDTAKNAREAFRLANHAMLIAQLRASREVRTPRWEKGRLLWDQPLQNPDPSLPDPEKGYWRAFQIAFLLMSVRGICEPEHEERKIVDLIWFPTGGGKTEAYLGLTAFTIFYNRLSGQESAGADVIMRYTLRLLSAQQFQRASLLICAMEELRRLPENERNLGNKAFRLGMWVGGDATPNTRQRAKQALSELGRDPDAENPFVLLKCPWCNAKFGSLDIETSAQRGASGSRKRGPRRDQSAKNVLGYFRFPLQGRKLETVVFRCPDPSCNFGYNPASPGKPNLPIVIIDEDIYDDPPDLIIGTVDKFAMIAWKPETRTIFGIGSDGKHIGLPPSLIIQDELHLISGPLGSMVGAYETVIEQLCTKRINNKVLSPKVVASTATISRATDQVRALYARDCVVLFPPSGLDASDSFFACEARDDKGNLKPGRLYAGIMAPGHGSQQTTLARVFAALLQYPAVMPVADGDESERDPWWTLMCFFNSLRELGGAATLLVADTRDYLRVILNRHGIPYNQIRQLLNWDELTGRVRSDRIPLAIQKLEVPFTRNRKGYVPDTVEVCLASNIIEVGIDIDRLSLMAVCGQPKTTSQYIQVSSRIGRNIEAPGLAVVTYNQSKPRDRSHYERFRAYHQRLYAQVEPTSVTPFSPPAVDRALHGIIVAAVRQFSPKSSAGSPRPFPLEPGTPMREFVEKMIDERITTVDPGERDYILMRVKQRLDEWKAWDPSDYGRFGAPAQDPPLMHQAGSRELDDWNGHSWPTLTSLRNVDASCEAEITAYYNEVREETIE